jgi:excisionase family DNA binding protein
MHEDIETNKGTIAEIMAGDDERLLYDRKSAALQLSISVRSLDYLIAGKRIGTRRIGKKVLIPRSELTRFARSDHPEPVS